MRASTRISAAERACWLAELAAAVDEAQNLLWRIGVLEGDNDEAKELYGQLESTRAEIDSLRGIHELACEAFDPDWMQLFPWQAPSAYRTS